VTPAVIHVASAREWRGGQRQVWLLARELAHAGLKQVVVTGRGSELAARLQAAGVRVRAVSWRAGLDPRVLWPIFRELNTRPAILHAHDAHALTLAGICATLARVPLVATRRVDFHLRRRGYWQRADRVIAISHAVARVLESDGISPERIVVVHSGISLEATRAVLPLGIRRQLGLAPDTQIAVNVGALVPHKDHLTLVEAAKRLEHRFPELHWIVAGEGELRHGLEQRIDALRLRGRVHLIGHIPQPERVVVEANVFVMSSQEEGLGTSVLEAMALGIPVASTSAGGLPELVGNGAGLLVPSQDPDALAQVVARLLSENELRQQLIERARTEVLRFSDRQMAEKVGSVYRSCPYA
jgi:glycosyltransferase involved in cell wall biosynthesis